MPMDKKTCQDYWAAMACAGAKYSTSMKNTGKRKNAAEKLVNKHPECDRYVTVHTSCAKINPKPKKEGDNNNNNNNNINNNNNNNQEGGRRGRKGTRKATRRGRKGTRRH
jgi:hypothetical protein